MIYRFTQPRWSGLTLALLLSAPAFAAKHYIEPVMVNIPGGTLTLQSPILPLPQANSSSATSNSAAVSSAAPEMTPPQPVIIKPFRMGKYEVTVKEYARFIAATNYPAPDQCRQMLSKKWFELAPGSWNQNTHSPGEYGPVTCIGWPAAEAYAQWLSKETGKHYRLPSEAEWEFAARAGATSTYPWGEDPGQACQYANIADHSANEAVKRDYDGLEYTGRWRRQTCDDGAGYASIVGSHKANAFGLHDMLGNLNEFTADCFNPSFSEKNADGSARTDGECNQRVWRGGSWHWAPFAINKRGGLAADFIGALEGFRLVEELDAKHPCNNPNSRQCHKLTNNNPFELELANARRLTVKEVTTESKP